MKPDKQKALAWLDSALAEFYGNEYGEIDSIGKADDLEHFLGCSQEIAAAAIEVLQAEGWRP